MRQYAIALALLVTGIGTQLQALHSWEEAQQPAWWGGTLIMVGAVVSASFAKPPGSTS